MLEALLRRSQSSTGWVLYSASAAVTSHITSTYWVLFSCITFWPCFNLITLYVNHSHNFSHHLHERWNRPPRNGHDITKRPKPTTKVMPSRWKICPIQIQLNSVLIIAGFQIGPTLHRYSVVLLVCKMVTKPGFCVSFCLFFVAHLFALWFPKYYLTSKWKSDCTPEIESVTISKTYVVSFHSLNIIFQFDARIVALLSLTADRTISCVI